MPGYCHGINPLIDGFIFCQTGGSSAQQGQAVEGTDPEAADLTPTAPALGWAVTTSLPCPVITLA